MYIRRTRDEDFSSFLSLTLQTFNFTRVTDFTLELYTLIVQKERDYKIKIEKENKLWKNIFAHVATNMILQ